MAKKCNSYEFKCEKCGKDFTLTPSTYYSRGRNKLPCYCHKCMKEMADKKREESFSKLSPEEQEKYKEKRNWYARASEEEKKAHSQRTIDQLAKRTPEEQAEINKKNSEGLKRHWKDKDDEYRKKRTAPMQEAAKKEKELAGFEILSQRSKEAFKKIPKEIQEKHKERLIEYNDSLPIEEKRRRAENMQRWHKNLSDEQKKELYERTHRWIKELDDDEYKEWCESQGDWYKNLSDEEKEKHKIESNVYDRLSPEEKIEYANRKREHWYSLPPEERSKITAKILSHGNKNSLQIKFEKMFASSIISRSFYIKEEVQLNNLITHSWDYGIFDRDHNLVMVVDLDGAFFHADNTEYNGIQSREEYDEKRSRSVPDGIKISIIQELNIEKCFEQLIKDLMLDYDTYIQNLFTHLRNIPFPTPQYSNIELIKSYNRLIRMETNDKDHKNISLNTRIGDHIIQHFHPSIYAANRRKEISPKEAWYNDELLMKCIKNRIIYQNHLNPNKILQGFNVSKIAPKVSVFSAGRAKILIDRYLSEYDTIFDPFSGFSGRMLGALSLNKNYLGQDISPIHVNESNDIIKFLRSIGLDINAKVECRDIMESYGTFDCLFTCPPYEDKEQWLEVPISRNTCDDWIDICLSHFKCKKYLFVVDYIEKYIDYVVDEIRNKSHLNMNSEYVVLIER